MLRGSKQISLFIPVEDWLRLRIAAAQRQVPMTELCREWLRPHLQRLNPTAETPSSQEHAA